MAQSLFKILRAGAPGAVIDVLAPGWSAALLARMPEVRRALDLPLGHGQLQFGLRRRLGIGLRDEGYDQAILLPNSLKSALIPWFARIPRRTGFVGEWRYGLLNDLRRLDPRALPMTVQRFVALGRDPGEPLPDPLPPPSLSTSPDSAARALDELAIPRADGPVLGLCPGAEFGPAKRWPQYAALARRYLERGWRVWLFGSDKDRAVTGAIVDEAPGCEDLAGRTRLGQAIDLMAGCDAVVSNDSGLMHVAAALGRPLVAIYGSSDPGFTPPLTERAEIVRLGLDCSPCFRRDCPLGTTACLTGITADAVDAALGRVLA